MRSTLALNGLKVANVTAAYKKGDPLNYNIYSQISTISNISKIVEKLVRERFYYLLDKSFRHHRN